MVFGLGRRPLNTEAPWKGQVHLHCCLSGNPILFTGEPVDRYQSQMKMCSMKGIKCCTWCSVSCLFGWIACLGQVWRHSEPKLPHAMEIQPSTYYHLQAVVWEAKSTWKLLTLGAYTDVFIVFGLEACKTCVHLSGFALQGSSLSSPILYRNVQQASQASRTIKKHNEFPIFTPFLFQVYYLVKACRSIRQPG